MPEPRVWVFSSKVTLGQITAVLGDEVHGPLLFEYNVMRDQWMVWNQAAAEEARRGNVAALRQVIEDAVKGGM